MLLGVGGGFGVTAREAHGVRFDKKPCLLSGADILSTFGALPPTRTWLSQDCEEDRGAGATGLEVSLR